MAKIEIFTGSKCAYCQQAKTLLQQKDIPFEELDISETINYIQFTKRLPRIKSIPQIFVNDEHIGGLEDLQILTDNGRLDDLLEQD